MSIPEKQQPGSAYCRKLHSRWCLRKWISSKRPCPHTPDGGRRRNKETQGEINNDTKAAQPRWRWWRGRLWGYTLGSLVTVLLCVCANVLPSSWARQLELFLLSHSLKGQIWCVRLVLMRRLQSKSCSNRLTCVVVLWLTGWMCCWQNCNRFPQVLHRRESERERQREGERRSSEVPHMSQVLLCREEMTIWFQAQTAMFWERSLERWERRGWVEQLWNTAQM